MAKNPNKKVDESGEKVNNDETETEAEENLDEDSEEESSSESTGEVDEV